MITLDATRTTDESLLAHHRQFLEASRAGVMRPLLLDAFGGSDSDSCHVLDAKYEPGKRAVVLYKLGSRLLRGVVSMDDDAADGVSVSPGVRVTRFPDDPQIPTLAAAANQRLLARELSAAIETGGAGFVHPRLQLLRYRPGRRATFRLALGRPGASRTSPTRPVPTTYIAKVYHDAAKAAAVAAEGRALIAEHDSDPALGLAPIVAHLPGLSVVVQQQLEGRELDCTLLARASRPAPYVPGAMTQVAGALAALHTRSVPRGRVRSVDKELDRFVSRSESVMTVSQGPGEAFLDLAYRLKSLRSLVPQGPVALVHGDCKPSQFLLRSNRVALLDLDHCGLADPAYDVGNFLATMRQLTVREAQGRTGAAHMMTWAESLGGSFVESYIESTSDNRDAIHEFRARVRWYEAVALERKALRAYARAPLSSLPTALLNEAHRRLDVDFQEAR